MHILKSTKYLSLFLLIITLSCSNDEPLESNNDTTNGFFVGNAFYEGNYVYLIDENTEDNTPSDLGILLSNVDFLPDNIESGLDYLYVDYNGINFDIGEKQLLDYRILTNASKVNGFVPIDSGTKLLGNTFAGDPIATSYSFTIIELSANEIQFEFTFLRSDGVTITGGYTGNYSRIAF